MPTTSTHRSVRITPVLLAGSLLLAPLTGCSFSSENVSCSGSTCTVTLSGNGAEAEILGTTLTLGGVENGKASLSVAGASVSCGEGETVTAGPLSLECSSVTDDSVKLSASLS
ncbi:MAG: hypothetical protein JWQ45_2733 [Blastococcus sp.]|jgi:hypothetical protein|nr:hypothetical protein [Blastococcus sp.]